MQQRRHGLLAAVVDPLQPGLGLLGEEAVIALRVHGPFGEEFCAADGPCDHIVFDPIHVIPVKAAVAGFEIGQHCLLLHGLPGAFQRQQQEPGCRMGQHRTFFVPIKGQSHFLHHRGQQGAIALFISAGNGHIPEPHALHGMTAQDCGAGTAFLQPGLPLGNGNMIRFAGKGRGTIGKEVLLQTGQAPAAASAGTWYV